MPVPEATRTRPAHATDAEAIFGFDQIAHVAPSRRASVVRSIKEGSCHVVETGGKVIAYGVIEHTFFGHGFIPLLYVAADWRRNGIGGALMAHLERCCTTPKLFTSTNQSNLAMQQLLLKLGYTPSGVIENLDEDDPELIYFKRRN